VYLCCGDALFDVFIESPESENSVSLSGVVGGSPLNVAIGLSRLGHHSRYFTKISSDPFGVRMARHLAENDLDTSLCIDTDQNTTLAIVEKQADGSAKYVFYIDNTADASILDTELPTRLPDDIKLLHVASYSTVLPGTGTALKQLVKRESANRLISYDPNLRLMIEPNLDVWRDSFEAIAAESFVIKASDEDVDALFGAGEYEAYFKRCFELGAQLVFLTRGPDGGIGRDANGQSVELPGVSVDVEDTVGAGDTFQAVVLHWLSNAEVGQNSSGRFVLQGDFDLEACLQAAIVAAGITCTKKGADLPKLTELQEALASN